MAYKRTRLSTDLPNWHNKPKSELPTLWSLMKQQADEVSENVYFIDGNRFNSDPRNKVITSPQAILHLRNVVKHHNLTPEAQRAFCRGFDLALKQSRH